MSITSDEVNYLIFRYLQESGYVHSAFSFAHESLIAQSTVCDTEVPAGALISYLQKGLQYVMIESQLDENGDFHPQAKPFSLLNPPATEMEKERSNDESASVPAQTTGQDSAAKLEPADAGVSHVLAGHKKSVYFCRWHPLTPLVCSGSEDGTVRIWQRANAGWEMKERFDMTALHKTARTDIPCGAWSRSGNFIAAGSYCGVVRVWDATAEDETFFDLSCHTKSVACLSWSPDDRQLATGSVDHSVILWDLKARDMKKRFSYHSEPVLDVQWHQQGDLLASCSTDRSICIWEADSSDKQLVSQPFKLLTGHSNDINCVRWAQQKGNQVLASGSDDCTVKVWNVSSVETQTASFEHQRGVDCLDWCPPGRSNLLVSGSQDATLRVWDITSNSCVHAFHEHKQRVHTVAFSPCGSLVASGSFDKCVHVYDLHSGERTHRFKCPSSVFTVDWSSDSRQLAAGCSNGTVAICNLIKQ